MTFTAFDIALPIGLGAVFGAFRYVERRRTDPENALRIGAQDALKGIVGMGIMTVILKYFSMI